MTELLTWIQAISTSTGFALSVAFICGGIAGGIISWLDKGHAESLKLMEELMAEVDKKRG